MVRSMGGGTNDNGMKAMDDRLKPSLERGSLLQPLREVGTLEKTQFWDLDEIYEALREANRLGIAPERLFQTGEAGSLNPAKPEPKRSGAAVEPRLACAYWFGSGWMAWR